MDFYFLLRCFISSITAKTFTGFDCTCVTRWVFYKKQEPLTLREHLSSPPVFLVGLCCSLFWFFSVVLLCVFTFWVLCCDVRCDFCIGRWSSCLSEGSCFVCAVYVCLPVMVSDACFCFVFLRHVWSVVPVFRNCQFLITPSIFFKVYLRVTKQRDLIRIAEIEILWCDVIDEFNVLSWWDVIDMCWPFYCLFFWLPLPWELSNLSCSFPRSIHWLNLIYKSHNVI
jgi:hypothetical protein